MMAEATWTGIEGGFPIIRKGAPFRCCGDAEVDTLRVARAELARACETVRRCTQAARDCVDGWMCGDWLESVVEDLEDAGDTDWRDARRAFKRGEGVLDMVAGARDDVAGVKEGREIPDQATWVRFEALGKALIELSVASRSYTVQEERVMRMKRNEFRGPGAEAAAGKPPLPVEEEKS